MRIFTTEAKLLQIRNNMTKLLHMLKFKERTNTNLKVYKLICYKSKLKESSFCYGYFGIRGYNQYLQTK